MDKTAAVFARVLAATRIMLSVRPPLLVWTSLPRRAKIVTFSSLLRRGTGVGTAVGGAGKAGSNGLYASTVFAGISVTAGDGVGRIVTRARATARGVGGCGSAVAAAGADANRVGGSVGLSGVVVADCSGRRGMSAAQEARPSSKVVRNRKQMVLQAIT